MCPVEGSGERPKGMSVEVIFRPTALLEVASRLC